MSNEFEERLAARYAGYTWLEYLALPGHPKYRDADTPDSKCHVVMLWRMAQALQRHGLIDARDRS